MQAIQHLPNLIGLSVRFGEVLDFAEAQSFGDHKLSLQFII